MKKPRGRTHEDPPKRTVRPSAEPSSAGPAQTPPRSLGDGELQDLLRDFLDLFNHHQLTELEVERAEWKVRLRRERPPAAAQPDSGGNRAVSMSSHSQAQPEPTPSQPSALVTVRSPIVGIFYRAPAPDADPYVEEGDSVNRGQVLCIVEAMKLMNEIEAEVGGRIVAILAESAKPVEYGQPLFLIEPASTS